MAKCIYHPSRDSVVTIHNQPYCAACQDGIVAARRCVDRHVNPKECFVWYAGSNNWQPIAGTGCAHWVAHQRNIHRGNSGEQCLTGFTFRVRVLIRNLRTVPLANVQVNDIYVTPNVDHSGLVIQVDPPVRNGDAPRITIKHCSSVQGGVAESEFATYFHGRGTFYR